MSITKALVQFDSEFDYLELRLNTIPDKPVIVNLVRLVDTGEYFISGMLNTHFDWAMEHMGIIKGFTVIMEM